VLLRLVLMFRRSPSAPLADLPFRWLAEGDQVLEFRQFGRQLGQSFMSVLKPDAILEVPERERRVFIEAETGTQSIVTAHPERTGAVIAKLRRYQTFFLGIPEGHGTWYRNAFHDGLVPRLLFIVHSEDRKKRVLKATKEALGSSDDRWVLVFTFAEAARKLLPYFRPPVTTPEQVEALLVAAQPGPASSSGAPTTPAAPQSASAVHPAIAPALVLDQAQLRTIGTVFQEMALQIRGIEEALVRHRREKGCVLDVPPMPREQMDIIASVVMYGETRRIRPAGGRDGSR